MQNSIVLLSRAPPPRGLCVPPPCCRGRLNISNYVAPAASAARLLRRSYARRVGSAQPACVAAGVAGRGHVR